MNEDEVRVVKKCAKCGAETDVTVTVSHEGRQQGWCPTCIGTLPPGSLSPPGTRHPAPGTEERSDDAT